jgi:hypothetical protein
MRQLTNRELNTVLEALELWVDQPKDYDDEYEKEFLLDTEIPDFCKKLRDDNA